jgi:hypothetical protein
MSFIVEASESNIGASIRGPVLLLPETATGSEGPRAPNSHRVRVFISFDLEHDEHLCAMLVEQSRLADSGFEVLGCTEHLLETGLWSDSVRRKIGEADQLIVICGEHTGDSRSVFAELRIAREERTPHFLLWGRRELMCTKPMGAEPTEAMYSWTPQILQERLAYTRRTDLTGDSRHCASQQLRDRTF